jgi:hypothetical protein
VTGNSSVALLTCRYGACRCAFFALSWQDNGPLLHVLIDWLTALCDTIEHAKELFATMDAILTPLCVLIRNSYDVTTKNQHGSDALSLLAQAARGFTCSDWPVRLLEALLDRGADVNIRSADGRTPLILWALAGGSSRASGLLLLLQRGADIDARDDFGRNVVHWLAGFSYFDGLSAFAEEGWLLSADLALRDNEGETALQIAQGLLAGYTNELKREVTCELLRATEKLWKEEARPLIQCWLSHSLLIPDVASIVLSYVDGERRQ